MANTLTPYLNEISKTLEATLNLRHLPSQTVERQIHAEVELRDNPKLLMGDFLVARNEQEKCLIEASVNSVRVSVTIKKGMEIEWLVTDMLSRFMALRADKFDILRKKCAHEGYDFSFLISDDHLNKYHKDELINFMLEFIKGIQSEITELKMGINQSAQQAANFF